MKLSLYPCPSCGGDCSCEFGMPDFLGDDTSDPDYIGTTTLRPINRPEKGRKCKCCGGIMAKANKRKEK